MERNMKIQHEQGLILVSRALDPRKMISSKIPENVQGGSAQQTQFVQEISENRIPGGRRFGHSSRGSRTNGWAPCDRAQTTIPCILNERSVHPNQTRFFHWNLNLMTLDLPSSALPGVV